MRKTKPHMDISVMKTRFLRSIATSIVVLASTTYAAESQTGDSAAKPVITVSSEIIRHAEAYEPLGVNNFGSLGGMRQEHGNIIPHAGFEPARIRVLHRVIESGHDNGHNWITLDGPGTSKLLKYASGYMSGASMRAYRFVDANGNPLPYKGAGWAEAGKILDATTGADCIKLFESTVLPKGTPGFPKGGWLCTGADAEDIPDWDAWRKLTKNDKSELKKQWRVYYDGGTKLRLDDVVIFNMGDIVWPDPNAYHPRMVAKGVQGHWQTNHGAYRYVLHPDDTPKEMNGGKAAMELTPQDGKAEVWLKLFAATGTKAGAFYGTLDGGVTYQYEAWVKESDAQDGEVILGFGNNKEGGLEKGYFGNTELCRPFAAPGEWTKIGFSFVAPPRPEKGGIEGAIIRYKGNGTLLVDNITLRPLFEDGDELRPFVIYQPLLATLMASQPPTGRKGALRSWFGLNSASMKSLCSWHPEGLILLASDKVQSRGAKKLPLPQTLMICEATGDSAETRMVPWLITQVTHDEDEYRQLIEYLCAPFDPKKDSPESKPLAYQRYTQRGHGRPWADDFRQIIIEFGNENWHNRKMAGWIGMGRFGYVFGGGHDMGLWAKYMISEMKKSPWYDQDVIRISLGGAYHTKVNDGTTSGYQPDQVRAAQGTIDYTGPATYVGPRWETGESSQTTVDEQGVQRTLLSYRLDKVDEWQTQAESMRILNQSGLPTRLTAYEGGPSGFGLRAKTKEEEYAGEYYGKSHAMGTAIADAWLDAYAKGWTFQCYLSFAQGKWWSSHTSMILGHRPSPGWLAHTLINRYMVNRNLLAVDITGSPTRKAELRRSPRAIRKNLPAETKDVPLLSAHATGDDSYLAVAVMNLDLEQTIAATIKLPMESASSITRHFLHGDPRDTNLNEMKVTIGQEAIDAARLSDGVFSVDLAPGRMSIFVFEK